MEGPQGEKVAGILGRSSVAAQRPMVGFGPNVDPAPSRAQWANLERAIRRNHRTISLPSHGDLALA
ncbi:BQ5605_C013g07381 [Microbotryum silenes-dioicae]|uniref:BQ5605_C013g07381 protein n=1 Tax=Microbotryum silenes-dioicae TaxID=796604 RepID=A0A2X0LVU0_9BASI|nr:BQ5605_C013g07381 [Microbotryum silenes-dioicae]